MVIFFTHSGAIKFQRKLEKLMISCTLMPVPRSLSSNCGIGAKVFYEAGILHLVDNEVEKVFEMEGEKYKTVYHNE